MVSSGFLQEPHGVTTQKTPFFIVTAVKTSNLKLFWRVQRGRYVRPATLPPSVSRLPRQCRILNISNPIGLQVCYEDSFTFFTFYREELCQENERVSILV
jgi:hypothetical protein